MLFILTLLIVVGCILVWRQKAKRINKIDQVAAELTASMTKKQAEQEYQNTADEALRLRLQAIRSQKKQDPQSYQDILLLVCKAAACQDRLHELDGLQHGRGCRKAIRKQFTREMKKAAQQTLALEEADAIRLQMTQGGKRK